MVFRIINASVAEWGVSENNRKAKGRPYRLGHYWLVTGWSMLLTTLVWQLLIVCSSESTPNKQL